MNGMVQQNNGNMLSVSRTMGLLDRYHAIQFFNKEEKQKERLYTGHRSYTEKRRGRVRKHVYMHACTQNCWDGTHKKQEELGAERLPENDRKFNDIKANPIVKISCGPMARISTHSRNVVILSLKITI